MRVGDHAWVTFDNEAVAHVLLVGFDGVTTFNVKYGEPPPAWLTSGRRP